MVGVVLLLGFVYYIFVCVCVCVSVYTSGCVCMYFVFLNGVCEGGLGFGWFLSRGGSF